MDDDARFWSKVARTGGAHSCWEWTGAQCGSQSMRYGVFTGGEWYRGPNGKLKRRLISAHRWAYMRFVGAVPDGMVVMHKCDNGLCVRPAHLQVGTQSDNIRDMYAKGRDAQERIRGDNHVAAVITSEIADSLRDRFAGGISASELAREFGIPRRVVTDVLLCYTWKHTPGATKHGPLRTRVYGPTATTLREAVRRGLRAPKMRVKLTAAIADDIRDRYAAGVVRMQDLADHYGVGLKTIHDVVSCTTWRNTEGAKRHGSLCVRAA